MKRTVILILSVAALVSCGTTNNSSVRDGNQFVPYEQRNGEEAVVYFTRNLSAEGLMAAYEKVAGEIGGKWFKKMAVGSHLVNYESLVALTHFKGHTQGGFGGANKNIGIGCADGRVGKAWTTAGR